MGYGLETVLNSMFCYKLPERAPDSEPPPVSCLVVGCKGTARLCRLPKQELYSETAKYYSQFLTISFTVIFISFIGILKYLWKQHHVFQWGRVAKHIFAIAGYIVVGRQETEVIDCIDVFGIFDDLL